MLAQAHRTKAERFEKTLMKLQHDADSEGIIELAWTAAFQWIAFGSETKYGQHQNTHTRLNRFLKNLGEQTAADWWETLDTLRQGGTYGGEPDPAKVTEALSLLAQIRQWATQ